MYYYHVARIFYICGPGLVIVVSHIVVGSQCLLLRFKAGAPRTEHYQLVRALSADAVVTVL